MRFLITGSTGMLGTDLSQALDERGDEVFGVDKGVLDITDTEAVDRFVDEIRPDVIVNCAAYTRVDDCEADEATASKVNGWAVESLADAANRAGSLLVQISTDFVFDGLATRPYEINDPVAPVSAYGRSKLEGEERARIAKRHVILRTSWLFGVRGWNFVEAIRKQILLGRTELRVVDDQRGCPTYTPHLASAVVRLADIVRKSPELGGVYHYSDAPECSWFDFATAIVAEMKREGSADGGARVLPTTSAEFPRPAQRPAYSVLSVDRYRRVTGCSPESWIDGLAEYFAKRPSSALAAG
ncbi:MAG: dTDP-4-dehydrorhamnose reductase [Acidobacteria bacterium]|nr:dTDP-4-dehydrorhamnose reductase [Acidobacteriota bacterium]